MNGRKSIEQTLSELKKGGIKNHDISQFTNAIISCSYPEIEKACLETPCLLDPIWLKRRAEELVSFIKTIETISYVDITNEPVLFYQDNKDFILRIQRKIIQYAIDDLLDYNCFVKKGIKEILGSKQHNLSATTLVYSVSRNIIIHLVNELKQNHIKKNLDPDRYQAVINEVFDKKQLERVVYDSINQRFFVQHEKQRKTFCEIVSHDKKVNENAHRYIEEGQKKIELDDFSRIYNTYPDLLDKDLLEGFAKELGLYIVCMNAANIIDENTDNICLKPNCEDAYWLEEFQKRIIQIGAFDLLELNRVTPTKTTYMMRHDVKACMESATEVRPDALLHAYVCAVDQSILKQAFPNGFGEGIQNKIYVVSQRFQQCVKQWIQDVLQKKTILHLDEELKKHHVASPPPVPAAIGIAAGVAAAVLAAAGVGLFFAFGPKNQDIAPVQPKLPNKPM